MEKYEKLILEITALAIKANRVTNHHFSIDFSGHVNNFEVYYFTNGYKKDGKNKIKLIDIWFDVDKNALEELAKCKIILIALIEGSENNG